MGSVRRRPWDGTERDGPSREGIRIDILSQLGPRVEKSGPRDRVLWRGVLCVVWVVCGSRVCALVCVGLGVCGLRGGGVGECEVEGVCGLGGCGLMV